MDAVNGIVDRVFDGVIDEPCQWGELNNLLWIAYFHASYTLPTSPRSARRLNGAGLRLCVRTLTRKLA